MPSGKHSTTSRRNGGREREGGKTQARKGTECQEKSTRKSIQERERDTGKEQEMDGNDGKVIRGK